MIKILSARQRPRRPVTRRCPPTRRRWRRRHRRTPRSTAGRTAVVSAPVATATGTATASGTPIEIVQRHESAGATRSGALLAMMGLEGWLEARWPEAVRAAGWRGRPAVHGQPTSPPLASGAGTPAPSPQPDLRGSGSRFGSGRAARPAAPPGRRGCASAGMVAAVSPVGH